MSRADEGVGEDEWLLRRIQEDQGPTENNRRPSALAFRPHRERDLDGLSLYRESFVSPEELAKWGRKDRRYFVARILVRDVQELGMSVRVVADPHGKPGHVILPELNATNRKELLQLGWQERLADLCETMGPYTGAH